MQYKSLLSLVVIFSAMGMISAQQIAKGYVYEDLNGNGKKDRREPGIAGVAVTNGVDVVQTDHKGSYALSVGKDAIISVIKPSGYAINTNEDQLAQFFYIHIHYMSTDTEFIRIVPTYTL